MNAMKVTTTGWEYVPESVVRNDSFLIHVYVEAVVSHYIFERDSK
jgi:hypothetical protein